MWGALSVGSGARYLRVGVAAIGLAFVLAIGLGATGVLTPRAQRTAAGASTTLTIISGAVSVRAAGGEFTAAADGALLSVGDTVRTGSDARAVLTYFEGTTVELEPSSELTIDAASAGTDGSTVLLMTQNIGRTWHVVSHLLTGNSKYEVRTPASTASVRGTQFEVAVTAGATTVTTSEGRVATSDPASTAEVLVTPGLTTTTRLGERPSPPVPAPAPERRVTVTVADPNTLIVDPLGRANGFKDGKVVVQTPGASVRIVDGKLVITLPNMPDGTLAAHAGKKGAADPEVEATVEERGSAPVTVRGRSGSSGSAGIEVHRGAGSTPRVTPVSPTGELPAPKIGEVPAAPARESGPAETPDTDEAGTAAPRPAGPGRVPEVRTTEPTRAPDPRRTAQPTRAGNDHDEGSAPPTNGFVPQIQLPGIQSPTVPARRPALPAQTPTVTERDRPIPTATTRGRP